VVVVESAPCSAFVVVEADLLLELLVITFDAPAQLGEAYEGDEGRVAPPSPAPTEAERKSQQREQKRQAEFQNQISTGP
jgi:hypothetical protein